MRNVNILQPPTEEAADGLVAAVGPGGSGRLEGNIFHPQIVALRQRRQRAVKHSADASEDGAVAAALNGLVEATEALRRGYRRRGGGGAKWVEGAAGRHNGQLASSSSRTAAGG